MEEFTIISFKNSVQEIKLLFSELQLFFFFVLILKINDIRF